MESGTIAFFSLCSVGHFANPMQCLHGDFLPLIPTCLPLMPFITFGVGGTTTSTFAVVVTLTVGIAFKRLVCFLNAFPPIRKRNTFQSNNVNGNFSEKITKGIEFDLWENSLLKMSCVDSNSTCENVIQRQHVIGRRTIKITSCRSPMFVKTLPLLFLSCLVLGGPLSYGICQTGCNAVVVACYAAAGFTFGTVTAGAGIPAAVVGCNSALGICMAGCVAAGFAPIP